MQPSRLALANAKWHDRFYIKRCAGSSNSIPEMFQMMYTSIGIMEDALTVPRMANGLFSLS